MDVLSVGIDVSKATLVIAVSPTGESWSSATTPAAIDALVARLQGLTPTIIRDTPLFGSAPPPVRYKSVMTFG